MKLPCLLLTCPPLSCKESRSQDKFMHDIHAAVAKHYVENLKEEVKKSMCEKAGEGIYPGRAPIGVGAAIEPRVCTPNDLWCTDYKGEFQLSDTRYCYPLTVTDYSSRYLLLCEAMASNREELAFPAFERLFHERGLPRAIRSDNGVFLRLTAWTVSALQALGLVAAFRHFH